MKDVCYQRDVLELPRRLLLHLVYFLLRSFMNSDQSDVFFRITAASRVIRLSPPRVREILKHDSNKNVNSPPERCGGHSTSARSLTTVGRNLTAIICRILQS